MKVTVQHNKTPIDEFYCQMSSLIGTDESGKEVFKVGNGDVVSAFKLGWAMCQGGWDLQYGKTVEIRDEGHLLVSEFDDLTDLSQDEEVLLQQELQREEEGDKLFVQTFILSPRRPLPSGGG